MPADITPRVLDRNARKSAPKGKRRFTLDASSCVSTGDLERVGYGHDADGVAHVVYETGAKQQTGIPADVIAEAITGGTVFPLAVVITALVAEHGKTKVNAAVTAAHNELHKS